jgi:hypothetical protein
VAQPATSNAVNVKIVFGVVAITNTRTKRSGKCKKFFMFKLQNLERKITGKNVQENSWTFQA